jgi:hypothetical protein
MQEADMSMTSMAMGQGEQAGDETLLVRFEMRPKQDQEKTEEEGRPIFTDTPYISIMQPGNKDSVVIRPASQMDKDRFPRHWEAFDKRQVNDHVEGTPLAEWPAMSRAQVEELRFMNVRTIEQLIGISDANSQGFMGLQQLKEKAKKYLEFSGSQSAANAVIAAENRVKELEDSLGELSAKFDALKAAPAPAPVAAAPEQDIAGMIARGIEVAMAAQPTPAPKAKRKRRTPAEMAAAKAEEEPKTE